MANARRFPDSMVLIFGIIIAAQLLTYVLPKGEFRREPVKGSKQTRVVANSYQRIPESKIKHLPAWAALTSIPTGLKKAQEIIFLIFIVGGVIAVLRSTGAIDALLQAAVRAFSGAPWVLIAGTMLIFSLGSYTAGMGEEYVPLIPLLITMSVAMRMDSVVALGIVWIPCGIGWACAGINPFGVLIAQDIAGVPPTSGWGIRAVMMMLFLAIGFHHVLRYSRRIQQSEGDPSGDAPPPPEIRAEPLTGQRIAIIAVFVAGIALFVYGVKAWHWYITELDAVFLGVGLIGAILAKMAPSEVSKTFVKGASEMTAAAVLVGFARTIEVVLVDGKIIDTLVNSIASMLQGAGPYGAATGMLMVQTICNFFIPSGSGQAFVTMPIMSPLATLTGVPQQVAVLAYQFGDGFTNMIVPTNALLMGTLVLAGVSYGTWFRFIGPLLIKIFALAVALLCFMQAFGGAIGFY